MSLPDDLQAPDYDEKLKSSFLMLTLHAIADISQIIFEALAGIDVDYHDDDDDDNGSKVCVAADAIILMKHEEDFVIKNWDMLARFAKITHILRWISVNLMLRFQSRRQSRQTYHDDEDYNGHHLDTYDQYDPARVHMAQVISELQASDLRDARNRDIPTDYLSALDHTVKLKQQQLSNSWSSSAASNSASDNNDRSIKSMDKSNTDHHQHLEGKGNLQVEGLGDSDIAQNKIQAALSSMNQDDFDINSLIRSRKRVEDENDTSTEFLRFWPNSLSASPKRQSPITATEFDRLKKNGEFETFKRRLFSGGSESEIRGQAWRFLLDSSSWHEADKKFEDEVETENYTLLKKEWIERLSQMDDATFSENASNKIVTSLDPEIQSIRDSYHRIEKDVLRTDRNLEFYSYKDIKSLSKPKSSIEYKPENNLEKLRDVLMTYSCCIPTTESSDTANNNNNSASLGYVQGMSDLASPILFVMNGDESAAFECFMKIMKIMKNNFRSDGNGMRLQLQVLEKLIRVADKPLHDHLEKTGSTNMFFIFRFILVLFKREFEFNDVLILWESIWSNPYTSDFNLLVAFAIIEAHRDVIIRYLRSPDEVLKYMNSLSGKMDVHAILEQAELAAMLLLERAIAEEILPPPTLTSAKSFGSGEVYGNSFHLRELIDSMSSLEVI